MRKHLIEIVVCTFGLVLCGVILTPSRTLASIIQAIIPQAVPTPNKRGTATVFQLATNTSAAVAGTPFCDDGSGNATTAGCTGGGTVPSGSSIFNSTSSATATAASATSLIGGGAATIPANTLITQDPLSTFFGGIYSIPGAYTGTLTIQLLIAGSSVASSGAITLPAAAVTNGAWRLSCQITVRTTGVSGTAIYSCPLEMIGSSLTSLTPAEASLANTATFSINTTVSNTIDVQATWSTTLGSPSMTGQYATGFIGGAPVTSVNNQTGGVITTSTSTYAGLPAASNNGQAYFLTDGYYLVRDNGSALQYWNMARQETPPPATGTWTQVNFGTSTTNSTYGGLYIAPQNGGGSTNLRVLSRSQPSTPYTLATHIRWFAPYNSTDNNFCGLGFRDSVSGKISVFYVAMNAAATGTGYIWQSYTNATTFSATIFQQPSFNVGSDSFIGIKNTGSVLSIDISGDGSNWVQAATQNVGTFLTPDSVIVVARQDTQGVSVGTGISSCTWTDWSTTRF